MSFCINSDMEPPQPDKPQRPRRRRNQKSKSEGGNDESHAPKKSLSQGDESLRHGDNKSVSPNKRKRSRRRKGSGGRTDSAAATLSRTPKKIDLEKDADAPLSKQEVAALREHLRFLQAHRKQLRLKVNAAEDLLLNGVTEPAHRGVCQHLLSKVDRGSVIAATERLAPPEAAKLLSGVIRFAADMEFILLYLEKVRLTTSREEATAALSQGLRRIDFKKVSNAQMRRVLDLITELFDEKQRPQLLLGLLESGSFRDAVDEASEHLPEPLAQLVVPLRAAQASVLHGKRNTHDPNTLAAGIRLLLDAPDKVLLHYPPAARQQLVHFGVQACSPPEHALHPSLTTLLASFEKTDRKYSELGITLARHLLASGEEQAASKLLKEIESAHPNFHLPGRWLEILAAKRIDGFALQDQSNAKTDVNKHHRWHAAFRLATMQPVWIQVCTSEHAQSHQASEERLTELGLPHVAPLLTSGTTPDGEAYFVIPNPGQDLSHVLHHKGGFELALATKACRDATLIFSALSTAGVALGDADLGRFAIDRNEQLWLIDLSGAQKSTVTGAKQTNFDSVQRFCREVFGRARRFIPPSELIQAVEEAGDCIELARALANSPALSAP